MDFSYNISRLQQLKFKAVQGMELLRGDVKIEFTYSKIFDTFEARKVSIKCYLSNYEIKN